MILLLSVWFVCKVQKVKNEKVGEAMQFQSAPGEVEEGKDQEQSDRFGSFYIYIYMRM